ncbi:MAG: hypothetical protein IPG50_01290 [Myxococcales bacterium]|nr:hypothetical protein [Myxococcales bacterium]
MARAGPFVSNLALTLALSGCQWLLTEPSGPGGGPGGGVGDAGTASDALASPEPADASGSVFLRASWSNEQRALEATLPLGTAIAATDIVIVTLRAKEHLAETALTTLGAEWKHAVMNERGCGGSWTVLQMHRTGPPASPIAVQLDSVADFVMTGLAFGGAASPTSVPPLQRAGFDGDGWGRPAATTGLNSLLLLTFVDATKTGPFGPLAGFERIDQGAIAHYHRSGSGSAGPFEVQGDPDGCGASSTFLLTP